MLPECIGDFQIAPGLVVRRAQEAHGRQERDSLVPATIEPLQQEYVAAGHLLQPPAGHDDSGHCRQGERHGLPPNDVVLVLFRRERGNEELPVSVPH